MENLFLLGKLVLLPLLLLHFVLPPMFVESTLLLLLLLLLLMMMPVHCVLGALTVWWLLCC